MEKIKICKYCGKEFEPVKANQIYCVNCRTITKVCIVCGKEFQCNIHQQKSTCSRACANKISRKQRPDRLTPDQAIMIATDLFRGKTLEYIAERNQWDIDELKQFVQANESVIQGQTEVCKARTYMATISAQHYQSDPRTKRRVTAW